MDARGRAASVPPTTSDAAVSPFWSSKVQHDARLMSARPRDLPKVPSEASEADEFQPLDDMRRHDEPSGGRRSNETQPSRRRRSRSGPRTSGPVQDPVTSFRTPPSSWMMGERSEGRVPGAGTCTRRDTGAFSRERN